MNYEEALGFIHGVSKFGTKLGLENIARLLEQLGQPQKKLKFIHVAGTNGKGTVTSTLASILKAQGYMVGMYTSPFIYDFCERIKINDVMISMEELAHITTIVKDKCDELVRQGFTHPTEFEIVTAIGMYYFAQQKCDFVALEVGLGGRLDATNVIDAPIVSVITAISYDHMEYLGNTLTDIAFEKCGIIKKGSTVAVYPKQEKEVLDKIREICDLRGVSHEITQLPQIIKTDLNGCIFRVYGNEYKTSLLGEHMVMNIATAVCAVRLLRESGVKISESAVREGIENVRWGGRFEIISQNPLFIIDGAHNVAGINALSKAVNMYLKGKKLVFIMGMLADKEVEESLSVIAKKANVFISTDVPSARALPGTELAKYAAQYAENVYAAKNMDDAVSFALAQEGDTAILAFGSLYMLGDARKSLCSQLHRKI